MQREIFERLSHLFWGNVLPVYLWLLEYCLCSTITAGILSIAHTFAQQINGLVSV